MILVPLILAKLALYCALCRFAVSFLHLNVRDTLNFSLKWGLARLGIGLLSGFPIFLAFTALQSQGLGDSPSYMLSFGIVRYFEWLLLLLLIAKQCSVSLRSLGTRGQLWLILGTVANIGADQLALAAGLDNLKFVC